MKSTIFLLKQHLDSAIFAEFETASGLNVAPYFFVSWRLANKYPHLLESTLVLSYQQSVPGPFGDRWKKQVREPDLTRRLFTYFRRFGAVAITLTVLQFTGTLSPSVQRVIIHLLQPLVFAGLIVLFNLCYHYPAFFAIVAVVFTSAVVLIIYDKWNSEKVQPADDDKANGRALASSEGGKELWATPSVKMNAVRPVEPSDNRERGKFIYGAVNLGQSTGSDHRITPDIPLSRSTGDGGTAKRGVVASVRVVPIDQLHGDDLKMQVSRRSQDVSVSQGPPDRDDKAVNMYVVGISSNNDECNSMALPGGVLLENRRPSNVQSSPTVVSATVSIKVPPLSVLAAPVSSVDGTADDSSVVSVAVSESHIPAARRKRRTWPLQRETKTIDPSIFDISSDDEDEAKITSPDDSVILELRRSIDIPLSPILAGDQTSAVRPLRRVCKRQTWPLQRESKIIDVSRFDICSDDDESEPKSSHKVPNAASKSFYEVSSSSEDEFCAR